MQPQDMRGRTKKFAVDVIRFAKAIPTSSTNREIARQLTNAACAVASGYRAVCRARSRADFIYKLGNTIEESDEAALWLEILAESNIAPRELTQPLWREADEIVRMLVRARETARANRNPSRGNNE